MKKYLKFTAILLIILLMSSTCFAATPVAKGDATMVLVEDNVCSMTFGEYGEFEKKMVQIDTENKTIDIRLTAKNNQEPVKEEAGEVVLLIDTSNSMSTNQVSVNGRQMSRKELVLEAAEALINQLLEGERDMQIGVVEFATSTLPAEEGTDADAKIVTPSLSSDKATLSNAINTVREDVMGPRTDVEIGLDKAEELLATSDNEYANKYIVVLTDAVPNTARGVSVDLYTEESADPTKAKLQELKGKDIDVISMLINISEREIDITGRPEDATFRTYKDVANYVFGTEASPVAGPVYYINDNQVIDTVTNDIYTDLTVINPNELTDIVIKDYFPKEIIDNFDFALLTEPEIGEVTATVNTSDNSITWTISKLEPGDVATFTYRLTLKETFSSDIVGKNLPTNENVTIDYKENGEEKPPVENDDSPVVALDVAPQKEIPHTGSNTPMISGILIASATVIAIISFVNYKRNNIK